jgi:hypothetical protein
MAFVVPAMGVVDPKGYIRPGLIFTKGPRVNGRPAPGVFNV